MEISKYIVPIFSDGKFNGNGFILNNGILVTAFHVVKEGELFFKYNEVKYSIDICDYIIKPEDKDKLVIDDKSCDLFVCLTRIEGSDISLSPEFEMKEKCEYLGHDQIEENDPVTVIHASASGLLLNIGFVKTEDLRAKELVNCITCTMELKPGNSGGPLFQNKKVIGMLIKDSKNESDPNRSLFIKSSYIIDALRKVGITYH